MIRDQLLNVLLAARDTVCAPSHISAHFLMRQFRLTDRVPFNLRDIFYGVIPEHRGQDAARGTRRVWQQRSYSRRNS
jgi:hypothetical protein